VKLSRQWQEIKTGRSGLQREKVCVGPDFKCSGATDRLEARKWLLQRSSIEARSSGWSHGSPRLPAVGSERLGSIKEASKDYYRRLWRRKLIRTSGAVRREGKIRQGSPILTGRSEEEQVELKVERRAPVSHGEEARKCFRRDQEKK
jgi:hypothetical protein